MRTQIAQNLIEDDSDDLITTGEAASVMGVSRQHVVDLCKQGDLPFESVGTHRRIRRGDIAEYLQRSRRMGRDERRSLWLGHVTAAAVLADPERARELARANIARMRTTVKGAAHVWLDEWEKALAGTALQLVRTLTEISPKGRELRQNTPFAGVLHPRDHQAALRAWQMAELAER